MTADRRAEAERIAEAALLFTVDHFWCRACCARGTATADVRHEQGCEQVADIERALSAAEERVLAKVFATQCDGCRLGKPIAKGTREPEHEWEGLVTLKCFVSRDIRALRTDAGTDAGEETGT